MDFDYLYKIILLGDSTVGKSNILSRITTDTFSQNIRPTIGIEFGSKSLRVKGKVIKLQIWDPAGTATNIASVYCRGSVGAIIVYDITNKSSFINVNYWMDQLKTHASDGTQILLVGNKLDLADKRQVSTVEGEAFAKEHECLFKEVSALNGLNVMESVQELNGEIYRDSTGPTMPLIRHVYDEPEIKEPDCN